MLGHKRCAAAGAGGALEPKISRECPAREEAEGAALPATNLRN